ncbi:MAG TPA: hypothetical protein PLD20_20920 [Blastocatellia bacterium]|nr:hypothetical protein [Blastocatellia bacterium]HMX26497.1 hypothetical protein [Blastocatellia bacterium]HMY71150.1 hypothetical protein [Blastocatellia bacterium]HMZ20412.1 hypothetical protein [Blastocatellia bacterium]HNG33051.1 hypothetical protein [Blastocatellia bacterium]
MRTYRLALSLALLSVIAGLLVFFNSPKRQSHTAQAAQFLRLKVPAVTHGFEKAPGLPDGDLFLQPKPVEMAASDPPETAKVFPINIETFGGTPETIGALPGVQPQGLSLSAPNSKVTAKTCTEEIWDSNLMIASTLGAYGDKVRLFLEQSDGKPGPELALFTVRNFGIEVTQLHPHLMLFVGNRFATGPMFKQGEAIPYLTTAGESGMRTDLLTFSWPMMGFSELQGCYRVGVEIQRGDLSGTTSVVFTDIVVIRNRVPGDENNAGTGLLRNLRGGFPTGFPCKAECPFPPEPPNPPLPPIPNPGGNGGDECNAICYRSPQYFRLNVNRLPRGTVIVGGANGNNPVSTTNTRLMTLTLAGGYTSLQKLNQEFLAAQLNVLNAGGDGSPKVFYAMEGKLSCYGLNFADVTLSNGFTLSPDTKLKELYQQARYCVTGSGNAADQVALTTIFDLLNGNNPLAVCNYTAP